MVVAARQAMARQAAKKSGPAPGGEPHRRVIASFKGSDAFEAWMDRLMKHARLPVSTLLEHALIDYAKAHGFDEEPPER